MHLLNDGMATHEAFGMSDTPEDAPDSRQEPEDLREALRACLLGDAVAAPHRPLPVSETMDRVCDLFEEAWVRHEKPDIGEYLTRVPDDEQPDLLCELVRLDVDYRRQRGDQPMISEYLSRFHEHAQHVESVLKSDSELWASIAPPGVGQDTLNALAADQTTLHAQPETPPSIAHFAILSSIGTGGFGTVWKARDAHLERMVAIKVPRKDQLRPVELARFLNEARSAASLNHLNIVKVHEVSRDPDVPYIVTEYIDGVSLREWLGIRTMTVPEAAMFCAKLARALQHAHERHIVHRDIKPENILVDVKTEPHLADFGLAKHDRRTLALEQANAVGAIGDLENVLDAPVVKHPTLGIHEGAVFGTAAYMSPEQARGDGIHATNASDIYSLGVVLFELLTGTVPFRGTTLRVLLHQVQHETPPVPSTLNSDIPDELEAICLKALAKEPSARFGSASELAETLEHFLHVKPVTALPQTRLRRAGSWIRRHWLISGIASATTVFLIMFVAAFLSPAAVPEGRFRCQLVTEPSGAKVAIVPLRATDRSLDPGNMIHPAGRTPLEVDLAPGDYLIVAEVENRGFHEVYRHVPKTMSELQGQHNHNYFKFVDNGVVTWRSIKIPSEDRALLGMSTIRKPISGKDPQGETAFFLDPTEFTLGEYRRIMNKDNSEMRGVPSDSACAYVSFDDAMGFAEELGKRLPEAHEYEYAATQVGAQNYAWGDSWLPSLSIVRAFDKAGEPALDRIIANGDPVYGLFTNVGEWTSTCATSSSDRWIDPQSSSDAIVGNKTSHLVWGAYIKNAEGSFRSSFSTGKRDPFAVPDKTWRRWLGFRCARSRKARMTTSDFAAAIPGTGTRLTSPSAHSEPK